MKRTTARSLFFATAAVLAVVGLIFEGGLTLGAIAWIPAVLVSMAICARLDRKGELGLEAAFALGVLLRWLVAAGVHIFIYRNQPGLFGPDEIWYDQASRYFAEHLKGRVPDPFPGVFAGGIVWFLSLSYYLFGYVPLFTKLANGIVGGWTAVITALIAARMFPAPVVRRAGLLAAIVPSLVLWSSLNTKDTSTLLGAELTLLAFLHLREKLSAAQVALFVAGLLLVASNRPYEVLFVGGGVMASFLFSWKRLGRNLALGAVISGALFFIIRQTGAGTMAFGGADESTIARLSVLREAYATGAGSAMNIGLVDTSTPVGLAAWLPIGFTYFYLAPIPFTGTSVISIATSPEMLIWYWLLPSLFRGLRQLLRRRVTAAVPVLAYALISSVGWSMVVTNVGTLYRYRAQVLFLPLICIAADQIRREAARRRRATQPLIPTRPRPGVPTPALQPLRFQPGPPVRPGR